jgi:tRNA1Val (adenine37-N6)-methyltransferase
MPNTFFQFKQFIIHQERCAMKVTTDASILGAWFAAKKMDLSYILDLGSGTGLLILMLAQKSNAEIHGIEIDEEAFQQLQENIHRSPWKEKCSVIKGDARDHPFTLKYDFIITNPPFYENQLNSPHEKINLARHSSSLSLEELFLCAVNNLTECGSLGILMPYQRENECIEIAAKHDFHLAESLQVRQTPGHDMFRSILHFSRKPVDQPSKKQLTIANSHQEYSPEFTELMKDYYLKC